MEGPGAGAGAEGLRLPTLVRRRCRGDRTRRASEPVPHAPGPPGSAAPRSARGRCALDRPGGTRERAWGPPTGPVGDRSLRVPTAEGRPAPPSARRRAPLDDPGAARLGREGGVVPGDATGARDPWCREGGAARCETGRPSPGAAPETCEGPHARRLCAQEGTGTPEALELRWLQGIRIRGGTAVDHADVALAPRAERERILLVKGPARTFRDRQP